MEIKIKIRKNNLQNEKSRIKIFKNELNLQQNLLFI